MQLKIAHAVPMVNYSTPDIPHILMYYVYSCMMRTVCLIGKNEEKLYLVYNTHQTI